MPLQHQRWTTGTGYSSCLLGSHHLQPLGSSTGTWAQALLKPLGLRACCYALAPNGLLHQGRAGEGWPAPWLLGRAIATSGLTPGHTFCLASQGPCRCCGTGCAGSGGLCASPSKAHQNVRGEFGGCQPAASSQSQSCWTPGPCRGQPLTPQGTR